MRFLCSAFILAPVLMLGVPASASAQSDVFCVCTYAESGICGGNLEFAVPGSCTVYLVLAHPSGTPVMAQVARVTVEGSASYVGNWACVSLNVGSGDDDRAVFTLNNGDANQQGTWGEVITLYSH